MARKRPRKKSTPADPAQDATNPAPKAGGPKKDAPITLEMLGLTKDEMELFAKGARFLYGTADE